MSETRIPCPRCGQDWLYEVRLVHLEQDAVFCPECNALWLTADEIAESTFREYGAFMIEHGRPQPHAKGELLIRGPVLKGPRLPAFRFKIIKTHQPEQSGQHIIEGSLESGRIDIGSEGALASNPAKRIKITGIETQRGDLRPTISLIIAPPDFPLSEFEGAVIVGD